MAIIVDGVEINELWIDGVEQADAWVDGVQVFSAAAPGEDYADNFTGDVNGTLIVNHQMQTGQSWLVPVQTPSAATIQPAVNATAQSSQISQTGQNTIELEMQPIVSIVNESFVAEMFCSWNPTTGVAAITQNGALRLLGSAGTTSVQIVGLLGIYLWVFAVDGVTVGQGDFPDNQSSAQLKIFYDGTDIAMEITAFPSGARGVLPRQSAGGIPNLGRAYTGGYVPAFGTAVFDIYNVTEAAVAPGDMPWPT